MGHAGAMEVRDDPRSGDDGARSSWSRLATIMTESLPGVGVGEQLCQLRSGAGCVAVAGGEIEAQVKGALCRQPAVARVPPGWGGWCTSS